MSGELSESLSRKNPISDASLQPCNEEARMWNSCFCRRSLADTANLIFLVWCPPVRFMESLQTRYVSPSTGLGAELLPRGPLGTLGLACGALWGVPVTSGTSLLNTFVGFRRLLVAVECRLLSSCNGFTDSLASEQFLLPPFPSSSSSSSSSSYSSSSPSPTPSAPSVFATF